MTGLKFGEGDRVRVIATGATGKVNDPDYIYGGVLIMPDEPERPWAPLAPYLPHELELILRCACGHPANAHEDSIGICDDCYCNAYRKG